MRLVPSPILIEDLEAARTHLGEPGAVVEDDTLDSARAEIGRAIDATNDPDNTYEDRVRDGLRHAHNAHGDLTEVHQRFAAVYASGTLRIGNASAAAVLASLRVANGAIEDWMEWARRELDYIA